MWMSSIKVEGDTSALYVQKTSGLVPWLVRQPLRHGSGCEVSCATIALTTTLVATSRTSLMFLPITRHLTQLVKDRRANAEG